MGLSIQKFLNTSTHFGRDTLVWVTAATVTIAFGVTRFFAWSGDRNDTTEANVDFVIGENVTVVQIIIDVPGNTLDGATTVRIRDDSSSVGDIITIGAGVTGTIITTLGTPPTIASGSIVSISMAAAGTAGVIQIRSIQVVYQRVLN